MHNITQRNTVEVFFSRARIWWRAAESGGRSSSVGGGRGEDADI